jgi:hypothetical protein
MPLDYTDQKENWDKIINRLFEAHKLFNLSPCVHSLNDEKALLVGMPIHIIQHGTDGFGHQLHGLLSAMILHDVGKYYFDACAFANKKFSFDHIGPEESETMKNYLISVTNAFNKNYKLTPIKYTNYIHSHELYKIPARYDNNTLYSIDNAYYFDRIDFHDRKEKKKHTENIELMRKYFMTDALPPSRLHEKNVVIHIRLGDAMTTGRGDSINAYNTQIRKLIEIFKVKYPDHHYYIHSDGDAKWLAELIGDNVTLFEKSTPLITLLSDFIYANVFICGNSGLSKICTFLGNKTLTIINDDNKQSVPSKNVFTISSYLNSNALSVRKD